MQHWLKLATTVTVAALAATTLTACSGAKSSGTSKATSKHTQPDISGTYFYVQSQPNSADQNANVVHKLVVGSTSPKHQDYEVHEYAMGGTLHDEGELKVNGHAIAIKMAKKSWALEESNNGARDGYDISAVKSAQFTFNKHVITISQPALRFYGPQTVKGKRLSAVYSGRQTWNEAFHVADKQAASSSNSSSNSSSSQASSSSSSSQATTAGGMNFDQIMRGDYSSLGSSWREAAIAHTHWPNQDGLGWSQDASNLSDQLTVTAETISVDGLTMAGSNFQTSDGTASITIQKNGSALIATLADQGAAINYSVSFYPQGTSANLGFNNGVSDDTSKNRIVVWSSNNSYTQYFVQE